MWANNLRQTIVAPLNANTFMHTSPNGYNYKQKMIHCSQQSQLQNSSRAAQIGHDQR